MSSASSIAAATAAASDISAAPAGTALTWSTSLECTVRASDLDALESRFGVKLPAALRTLFLEHSGQQAHPASFLAQNVTNGKWRRETMGVVYPATAPKDQNDEAEDDGEEDDENNFSTYNVAVVNEMFMDDFVDADEDEEPAASAAAASSNGNGKKKSLPFFAFSECAQSGHLIVLDTRSQHVMLLDVTRKRGPWIAGETVEDFLTRLTEGATAITADATKGDDAPEEDIDEAADEEDMMNDDFEEQEDENIEDAYQCDGCQDEIVVGETRYHCLTRADYDLCAKCFAKSKKKDEFQAIGGSTADGEDHDDGEEEEEKATKPVSKKAKK